MTGYGDKKDISARYSERSYLSIRMGVRRFTRPTVNEGWTLARIVSHSLACGKKPMIKQFGVVGLACATAFSAAAQQPDLAYLVGNWSGYSAVNNVKVILQVQAVDLASGSITGIIGNLGRESAPLMKISSAGNNQYQIIFGSNSKATFTFTRQPDGSIKGPSCVTKCTDLALKKD